MNLMKEKATKWTNKNDPQGLTSVLDYLHTIIICVLLTYQYFFFNITVSNTINIGISRHPYRRLYNSTQRSFKN